MKMHLVFQIVIFEALDLSSVEFKLLRVPHDGRNKTVFEIKMFSNKKDLYFKSNQYSIR